MLEIPTFFLRKLGLTIGDGSRIAIGTVIVAPERITIGKRTIINENCHLDGRGGLEIGDDVSISIYTKIITASHRVSSSSFEYYGQKTDIRDNVWIGCGAIILDGSTLEETSVVGAGCVFKGKAEAGWVYVGNPAKPVKTRGITEAYHLDYAPYFR